ncbi:D-inositol 3-phosphate glycosyltransferase [Zhongshania aliphaticivorans]|uniref:D-inositol 3-phosphate glycosyltransferase n=1 Tax=Zhongshania aliphaticivorans TaxID=1470434 RepID=A0A5S9PMM6_9GAMM|nr:glycosyltransferase family 4 protein [Zhongshania aliphaticivorans]CAA0105630.1 D-inositol 3-phosphate glycosyltransferase [Zhongshania aliphaticivorans]CAA0105876.1 D-inositol 3-phosphate glycosyltransferase [Zhongshania aliphaticivorans]
MSEKIKILLITNMYPSAAQPSLGTFVQNCAEGLEESGADVTVLSLNRGSRYIILNYLIFFYRVLNLGLKGRWDFFYFHYISLSGVPVILLKLFRPGIKIVGNIHGSDIADELGVSRRFSKLRLWISKIACRISDFIVVPSEYYKNVAEEFICPTQKDFFVSPSGGLPDFFFDSEDRCMPEIPTILFVGRLVPGKGVSDFLAAVEAVLLVRKGRVRVIIVGDGPQKFEVESFSKRHAELVELSHILSVSQRDLVALYRESTVFVFPSLREAESLGLVVVEALASGTPVIAYKNGALEEVLSHGKTGYLVAKSDSKLLGDILLRVMEMDECMWLCMSAEAKSSSTRFKNNIVSNALFDRFKSELVK